MYKLTLQNEQGNSITFNELNGPYTITDIDGLSPADANINLTDTALLDGQRFNSAKVNLRTFDIAFAIEYDAEYNRLQMYDVLHVKRPITLFYKSDLRDVYIEGYVQKVHVTHFEKKQIATVTIICPSPFFKNAQEVINELTNTIKMFHFPFYGIGGTSKNLLDDMKRYLDGTSIFFGGATSQTTKSVTLPAGTYTYSVSTSDGTGVHMYVNNIDTNVRVATAYTAFKVTFTIDEPMNLSVWVYHSRITSSDIIKYAQIEKGTEATAYEPYYSYKKNIVFGEEQFLTDVTVVNEGELITGFIVEFYASNNVSNPRVINYMTNEYIGIIYDMIPGDLITINTLAGEKTVTLLRGGAEINLFNYVQDGSTWLQLEPGENTFVYEVGAGQASNLTVTFRHYDLFEGV